MAMKVMKVHCVQRTCDSQRLVRMWWVTPRKADVERPPLLSTALRAARARSLRVVPWDIHIAWVSHVTCVCGRVEWVEVGT